jgi:N utilization substance protein B
VPIKVSINEYIDISKLYSTPKSKDFVNGIVDKIKNELLRDGKIQKAGRGLIND